MTLRNKIRNTATAGQTDKTESGFTLIEVAVAMLVIMIALLGVFVTFTWAITYNAGNNSRAQALAVLQEEVERLRSLKFTPSFTDADLAGGTRAPRIVVSPNGGTFGVRVEVDDDPATAGTQIDANSPLKEIRVAVRLERPSPGWQAAVPATVIMRRVRSN